MRILALALGLLAAVPAAAEPSTPLLLPGFGEVHPNPPGPDAGAEWFELHNPLAVPLPLDGWAVTDHDPCFAPGQGYVASYAYRLDGHVVPANGWLAIPIVGAGGCLRLGNAADDLTLLAPGGRAADAVAWGTPALAAPLEGQSLARCAGAEGWGPWSHAEPSPGAGCGG